MSSITDRAIECLNAHLSVVPIRSGSKLPAGSWKPYQTNRMTIDEAGRHFADGCNIALAAGAVSGNLECLDFDKPELFKPFGEIIESVNPDLKKRLSVWQETPSGGFHLLYRCSGPVAGNTKLAMSTRYQEDGKPRQDVFIETRGEGGYFLIDPSIVGGNGYTLHDTLESLPVLSLAEHDLLHGIARSFDEADQNHQVQAGTSIPTDERPGDRFNQETDWRTLLEGYGWRYLWTVGGRDHWQRPGKGGVELSATLNGQGLFCFSTSTPLPTQKPLDKFGVFAWYEHNGDFAAAARALNGQDKGNAAHDFSTLGGQATPTPPLKKERSRCLHIPDELLNPGGLISRGMEALSQPGQVDIPQYNLPTVLSVIGAAIAGKISFMDDVWPNTFAVKIGPTSTGKTSSNKTMSKALIEAGCAELFGPTDIASGAALWRALESKPRCLLMIDEATSLFIANGCALLSARTPENIGGPLFPFYCARPWKALLPCRG